MKIEIKFTDDAGNVQKYDLTDKLPSDEEIDAAAIEFVNNHCGDSLNGDLTVETECFDAGAVWMRNKFLNNTVIQL
jgi:hypothetical protein